MRRPDKPEERKYRKGNQGGREREREKERESERKREDTKETVASRGDTVCVCEREREESGMRANRH